MPSHPEDVPPPPYTETDIFSSPGRDAHFADDTSRSTTSTNGDVIYTPPLTPRSSHQSNFAGEVDHGTSSAAAAYFETRPPPLLNGQPQIVHSITILPGSTPDNLPYPNELAARDVRLEDWQTFTNYLLPNHSASTNEQIIDRKLRAEAMTATDTNPSNNHDDARSQSSGRSHAEAHLNRIRSPVDVDEAEHRHNVESTVHEWNDGFFGPRRVSIRVDLEPVPSYNNHDINRGLTEVSPQPLPEKGPQPIPGAWDSSFDQLHTNPDPNPSAAPPADPAPRRGLTSLFGGRISDARSGGAGAGPGAGGGGFRFAGLNIQNDRVSLGNTFVADGRTGSLRIGGIVADGNGIRINGRPMFGAPGEQQQGGEREGVRGRGGPGSWGPPGWGMGGPRGAGGWGWGGGPGGCGRGGAGSPWGMRGGGWGRGGSCGRGGWWNQGQGSGPCGGGEGEQARGRGEHRGPGERHHSRSSSASSVSSRSSSVHSESSVGSLPDYDDLKDSQLPIAKQFLEESLHHPDQKITKERVKQIREQIKAAKKSSGPTPVIVDKTALRREVKDLLRDWKQLKRQQKRDYKQLRREQKHRRRQEKRERRHTKREMKRAAKETKRDFRRGPFGAPPMHHAAHAHAAHTTQAAHAHAAHATQAAHAHAAHATQAAHARAAHATHAAHMPHIHMPPMPPMPPIHMPSMPPMPPIPPMPPMPPMPHQHHGPPPGFNPLSFNPWGGPDATANPTITRGAPGAWPADDNQSTGVHDEGVASSAAGYVVSQAKYQAAWEMEAKVAEKEAELLKIHERIAEDHFGDGSGSGGKGEKGAGVGSKMEAEALAVEREIDELARVMERLRTEADEEFARELAEEEERAARR